ncbi:dienelactone hydrolase family protein [Burkholderia gladioli]|uniref:dienelactone hydrolase family protein n=1 Tax=Burkholderia gladioli TaxID=28095 RepID=UPI0038B25351
MNLDPHQDESVPPCDPAEDESLCRRIDDPCRESGMLDLHDAFLLTDDKVDLARAWDGALVVRPEVGGRIPVVLHMHGAYGIGECEAVMATICNECGFAFVAPDSFARRYRKSNCIAGTIESGTFPPADVYRRAELIHAHEQLMNTAWVDPDRVVLSGYSEGGEAVAVWGHLVRCRAAIITAWSCRAPAEWGWADGLRLPAGLPVLQALAQGDPWFDRPGWHPSGLEPRAGLEQLIVADCELHEAYRLEVVKQAYRRFLGRFGKTYDTRCPERADHDAEQDR